jgi:Zn-dependent protease with chaperone function
MKVSPCVYTRLSLCLGVAMIGGMAVLAAQQTTQRKTSLREGPGSFFPVVTRLPKGTPLDVSETRGGWVAGRTPTYSGWVPSVAFQSLRQGMDYAGLLNSEQAVVISSVDIAAATKGAFETKYAETYQADFNLVDRLEGIRIDPMLVSHLLGSLEGSDARFLRTLPRPVFDNNVILQFDAEQLLGRAMAATLITDGFIESSSTIEYVNAVAAVVVAKTPRYELPFRVAVVKDAAVNGFGLPGGYIVITEGMLASMASEAELACQIGHEIAHTCLFHGLREFKKRETHRKRDAAFAELDSAIGGDDPFAELDALTGDTTSPGIEHDLNRLANTSYLKIIGCRAREDELEADLYGAAYAAAAGYDPNAMITYLERVRDQGGTHDAFRHHPAINDRIAALRMGIRRYRLAQRGQALKHERYASRVNGQDGGE